MQEFGKKNLIQKYLHRIINFDFPNDIKIFVKPPPETNSCEWELEMPTRSRETCSNEVDYTDSGDNISPHIMFMYTG